jgi:hypothetical protein
MRWVAKSTSIHIFLSEIYFFSPDPLPSSTHLKTKGLSLLNRQGSIMTDPFDDTIRFAISSKIQKSALPLPSTACLGAQGLS